MKIVTHKNVDADAVISIFLLSKVYSESFNELYFGENIKDAIYIDTTPSDTSIASEVLDHHQSTEYKSCAEYIWTKYKLEKTHPHLRHLVEYANELDTARWTHLSYPYKYFTLTPFIQGMRGEGLNDHEITVNCLKVLKYYENYLKELYDSEKMIYEELNKTIKISNVNGYKVAIVIEKKSPFITGLLYEKGVDFLIYKEGNNIGISRSPFRSSPSLTELKKYIEEDGWFFHASGFLACRGSIKYPASTPSKYTPEDLLKLIGRI